MQTRLRTRLMNSRLRAVQFSSFIRHVSKSLETSVCRIKAAKTKDADGIFVIPPTFKRELESVFEDLQKLQ